MDHVVIRKLAHLTGSANAPNLGFLVETRDRPGPAYKNGAFEGDTVWVQLEGGLIIAKATVQISWVGEYAGIDEVRRRTKGSKLHGLDDFWARRPKYGYAAVAQIKNERWLDPYWAGPRSYGYEWVIVDDEKKRSTWLEPKPPPRGGSELLDQFAVWKNEPA